tara:strand:- start:322 stop:435 length:114 start_codon:yes stop_codon:yes gene_type:complete
MREKRELRDAENVQNKKYVEMVISQDTNYRNEQKQKE